MFVSLNPTYFCNFNCEFCYLTKDQLQDKKHISIPALERRLEEIIEYEPIEQIDLYGGEIALLPNNILFDLFAVIERYTTNINIITNLSAMHCSFFKSNVSLSVSYDFDCREKSDLVLRNIVSSSKDIHILMLASKCLIQKDVEEMIQTFNGIRNITSVEIKPYSSNQANQDCVSFADYEEFVKQWINSPTEKNFTFVNLNNIRSSLLGNRNAFSDDHIYITPDGNFAVLDFDKRDNEYFLPVANMAAYYNWARMEKIRVESNPFCSECKYLGNCLSEHIRPVKDLTYSCNGFKHLIDWYNETP